MNSKESYTLYLYDVNIIITGTIKAQRIEANIHIHHATSS